MRNGIHLSIMACLIVCLLSTPTVAVEQNILGTWVDATQKPAYHFIAGFKPDTGAVIVFENGEPEEVRQWSIDGAEIKIGYNFYDLQLGQDTLQLDTQIYAKIQEEQPQDMLVSLKENPGVFIEHLAKTTWFNPADSYETGIFILGFTPDSGIYSFSNREKVDEVSSWNIENDVLKMGSTIYPNAKLLSDYLVMLDSYDNISIFQRGKPVEEMSQTDLTEDRENFLDLLTRGTWQSGKFSYDKNLYEFRPTFGDLSGSIFEYRGTTKNLTNVEDWEYSPKTGVVKWGYTEYVKGKVIGDYLLLQESDGDAKQFVRAPETSLKKELPSTSSKISISERELTQVKSLLSRQWINHPYHYIITFNQTKPQGFVHEFRSLPFVIAGNTMKIQGLSDVEELWQWEDKVIFNKNSFSLQADASPVYMTPVDKERALAISQQQASSLENMQKDIMSFIIELKDGKTITLPVSIKDFSEIQSIRIQPK